eukprot:CAMPEP_0184460748 /NCGR_PEP_ID=MMETSP0740-20130409/41749_1 /TAXON_ID=385413 /ORGANISM="Thalassiosira miniscula, Strain CCMP1093" /LENGTH=49 /DNA_ID= /DNA_START= /DNA_END= /DNA_ORIENTATION=
MAALLRRMDFTNWMGDMVVACLNLRWNTARLMPARAAISSMEMASVRFE